MSNFEKAQWFIITAIGGKEESIAESLREKIKNFGYDEYVKEIKVFREVVKSEEVFSKNSPELPKIFKTTKTTSWVDAPNNTIKRVKSKVINKFPGYIFINMIMNSEIWYTIRNTSGVLGFVGSSGKGAMPIPITIEEFDKVGSEPAQAVAEQKESKPTTESQTQEKKVFETDLKVGYNVEITSGAFAGSTGEVKKINVETGKATIEVDLFGRAQVMDINFDELKIA